MSIEHQTTDGDVTANCACGDRHTLSFFLDAQPVGLDVVREERDKARQVVMFFASVIKSGEPWTDTCEREFRAALAREPQRENEQAYGPGLMDKSIEAVSLYENSDELDADPQMISRLKKLNDKS